jgi:hypothetical protein
MVAEPREAFEGWADGARPVSPTVPCRWCGKPTEMTGTRECDAHWELNRRICAEPEMARRMLAERDKPMPSEPSEGA